MTTKHSVAIERMTEEDARTLIQSFINNGWQYTNLWELGGHAFATFVWDNENEPIYPQEYQQHKN